MEKFYISVPENLDTMALPDPSTLVFYRDLEERKIWIDDEINECTLDIVRLIIQWNREDSGKEIKDRKPIKIFFFSVGGEIDVENSLVDIVALSKTPIIGINMGRCMSAAAYIYLACHKRYSLPQATFLFHQGSAEMSGTYLELKAAMESYEEKVLKLVDYMKKYTKYSEEQITQNIVGEWYVSADEALEYGVCDKIIDDVEEIL